MYNVKGPSKIVAKTRRGLGNIDNYKEVQKIQIKSPNEIDHFKGPRPVFNNFICRRRRVNRTINNNLIENRMTIPQHEEIVEYINQSWNRVHSELDSHSLDGSSSPDSSQSYSTVYYEDEETTALENFEPFDLDTWWGKRLFTSITNSVNEKS